MADLNRPEFERALLVVAKQPTAGQTKTRLCPPLSGQVAADLYACFLQDTLEIMRQVPDVCASHRLSARGCRKLLSPAGP